MLSINAHTFSSGISNVSIGQIQLKLQFSDYLKLYRHYSSLYFSNNARCVTSDFLLTNDILLTPNPDFTGRVVVRIQTNIHNKVEEARYNLSGFLSDGTYFETDYFSLIDLKKAVPSDQFPAWLKLVHGTRILLNNERDIFSLGDTLNFFISIDREEGLIDIASSVKDIVARDFEDNVFDVKGIIYAKENLTKGESYFRTVTTLTVKKQIMAPPTVMLQFFLFTPKGCYLVTVNDIKASEFTDLI